MKVKIKRFDKTLPLPEYKTEGAACLDLYARISVEIKPQQINYVPVNIALEVPSGHWIMVAARSSTHKHGLMLANGIAIGDSDFKGDNDEYVLPFYNFKDTPVTVEKGMRIAQMMVVPYDKVELVEVEKLESKDRGGFGTTGDK